MRELSVEGFVRKLWDSIEYGQEPRYAFFLGAGCSVSSGIPTAGDLVRGWLRRLKYRDTGSDGELDEWASGKFLGYTNDNAAAYYGQVIEELFHSREERQQEIERLVSGHDPGFGYATLAQLMNHTTLGHHFNVALTTNFDDMVADALYLFGQRKPLVIAHESLTGFIRPSSRRPLVVKVHGDARLEPHNTNSETAKLDQAFELALKPLLADRGLIFVGYGGGDTSIAKGMGTLPTSALPWPIYWINERAPSEPLLGWLEQRNAIWIRHRDFDHLMALIFDTFTFSHPPEQRFSELMKSYMDTWGELFARIKPAQATSATALDSSQPDEEVARVIYRSWWDVELAVRKVKLSDPERADAIYREGLAAFPNSSPLIGSYALFLWRERKDINGAEELYKRAIEADPKYAYSLGAYALFLRIERKDIDGAEALYKRAIEADPKHANNLGAYALFLHHERKDMDGAEAFYKRAIEADPKLARNLGNYALFLHHERKDMDGAEALYKRAIEADPKHVDNLGAYALFLRNERKDMDGTEALYKRAIEADPKHANNLGAYALLLRNERKDMDGAEALYKRAIEADPKHANNLGAYALFLHHERKDMDGAEAFYKRAIEADPKSARNVGNYALFLRNERKDMDGAEALYKRAVEVDPEHPDNLGNYALFLRIGRKDIDGAEALYKRAVEADPKHAHNLGAYAVLLHHERKDIDGAEALYKRAIEADPKHVNNLGNYCGFLLSNGSIEGLKLIDEALALSADDKHQPLALECHFYSYAHRRAPQDLTGAKSLIKAGVRSPGWDLSQNCARARQEGHPEPELLEALAKVIAEELPADSLEQFSAWRAA